MMISEDLAFGIEFFYKKKSYTVTLNPFLHLFRVTEGLKNKIKQTMFSMLILWNIFEMSEK